MPWPFAAHDDRHRGGMLIGDQGFHDACRGLQRVSVDRALAGDEIDDGLPGLARRSNRDRSYFAPNLHAAFSSRRARSPTSFRV
jgi:hypothetical protein